MKIIASAYTGMSTSLSLLLLIIICGCSKAVDSPPGEFTGILITYENGAVGGTIGDASDDWQPIPIIGAELRPAAPNPATTVTMIRFELSQQDSVRLWLESAPGRLDSVIYHSRVPMAGVYAITVSMAARSVGIYRLYMTVYRDGSSYTTYGDIKKE